MNLGLRKLLQRARYIRDFQGKGTGAISNPISIGSLVSLAPAVSAHEIIHFPKVRLEQHFTTDGNLKAKQTH